jgi:hypothetical protein
MFSLQNEFSDSESTESVEFECIINNKSESAESAEFDSSDKNIKLFSIFNKSTDLYEYINIDTYCSNKPYILIDSKDKPLTVYVRKFENIKYFINLYPNINTITIKTSDKDYTLDYKSRILKLVNLGDLYFQI